MRIREAQKHTDPDPEHCLSRVFLLFLLVDKRINCGSGSSLFITDKKNFVEKIMVAEEVFVIGYNFNPITKSQNK
jgi:hypothetical protein